VLPLNLKTLKRPIALLALIASTALAPAISPAPVRADDPQDPRNGQSLPDDAIGIVNLNDQDLADQLRKCLRHHPLGECLKRQTGGDPNSKRPFQDELEDSVDRELVSAWRYFLYDEITPSQALYKHGKFGVYLGFQVGSNRIDMDQVLSDPNKLATERKLHDNAIWVKHELELMPQVGYGFDPQKLGIKTKEGYYGGLASYNAVLRMTRRHPMDEVYNKDFWGFLRQDAKAMGQAIPMYLTITDKLNGNGLLPGEGIEL
jgi:hypothetical protein